jgi:hypothetical protein
MQRGPNFSARRTPSHLLTGCGGLHLNSPTGAAAYGIPLKARTPDAPRPGPSTTPPVVFTRSGAAAPDPAATHDNSTALNKTAPPKRETPNDDDLIRPDPLRIDWVGLGAMLTAKIKTAGVTPPPAAGKSHRVERAIKKLGNPAHHPCSIFESRS